MKFAVVVLALFSALCTKTNGSIDIIPSPHDETFRGRNLVETPRGLWIESHYIAIGKSQEVCDGLVGKIAAWKAKNNVGLRASFTDGSDDVMNALSIRVNCFLSFVGSESLATYVKEQEGVVEVEYDFVVNATGSNPPSWGLNRIDQPNLPLSKGVPFNPAFTGKGVNVYVIDSGVRTDHTQFAVSGGSRAAFGYSVIGNEDWADLNGHGTHCAGTIAGSTYGVANGANIIAVKVLSGSGSGSTQGVINGIEWAVAHQRAKYKSMPAVISMSLGGGLSTAMETAVNDAAAAGNIVVVAAGNEAVDACKKSPASAGGKGRKGGVITVGATTSSDDRASYSNFGSCVDIFAPGTGITSAWFTGVDKFNTLSGTSMATPHVAGVAASLLEKHGMNRDSAQAELFAIAVGGKIGDTKYEGSNILLQIPTYTGPPTPATPTPTMPPTMPPPTLCINDDCFGFETSTFGPRVDSTSTPISGTVAIAETLLCSSTKEDFKGKIVFVSRGSCQFYTKVMNAAARGALAVFIYNYSAVAGIFSPNYYGFDRSKIPSGMISLLDFKKIAKLDGKPVVYGSVVKS